MPEAKTKVYRAEKFLLHVAFNGAPATIVVRVFLDGKTIRGVRSLYMLSADGERLPSFVDGTIELAVDDSDAAKPQAHSPSPQEIPHPKEPV